MRHHTMTVSAQGGRGRRGSPGDRHGIGNVFVEIVAGCENPQPSTMNQQKRRRETEAVMTVDNWPEIIITNRNALVAAPSCRVSRAGLPFVGTAWSQGEGHQGATQSLRFGLASAALPSLSVLVLSAATVVGNVLALGCRSQIALPLFRCLFVYYLFPPSKSKRKTGRPLVLVSSPPEPTAPLRIPYRCCSTGHRYHIPPRVLINRDRFASSEYTRLPLRRFATHSTIPQYRIPAQCYNTTLFLAIHSPEIAPSAPGVAFLRIPVPPSTPTSPAL
ncbi:hypothetical protein QBC39DRAFT_114287 [Podospora conica]|nr:hypothetical protein QBC39DRAFT_114287 [Schizothecium conicum]